MTTRRVPARAGLIAALAPPAVVPWKTRGSAPASARTGYLTGTEAPAAACDARTIPVVIGTTEARSPDGKQVLYSHAPPSPHAA